MFFSLKRKYFTSRMPLSCALKVFIGIYFEAQTPKLKLLSTQMVVIRPVLSIIVLSGNKKNTPEHSDTACSVSECCCVCSKVKERTEFHSDSHSRTIHTEDLTITSGNYTTLYLIRSRPRQSGITNHYTVFVNYIIMPLSHYIA